MSKCCCCCCCCRCCCGCCFQKYHTILIPSVILLFKGVHLHWEIFMTFISVYTTFFNLQEDLILFNLGIVYCYSCSFVHQIFADVNACWLPITERYNVRTSDKIKKKNYLITWNFRDMLISRSGESHISRHLIFAIFGKFCILTHLNFAFLSETQFISLSMLFYMSLNLIKQLNQQCRNKQKRSWLCKQ